MAYGEEFNTSFQNLGKTSTYDISILKDGYGGGSTAITNLAVEPLVERTRQSVEKDLGAVIGTEMEFRFIITPEDGSTFDNLFTATEKQYKIEVSKDASSYFTGFLRSENINKTLIEDVYEVTLSFADNLGYLKTALYVDSSGDTYDDQTSVLQIIKRCLEKTDLELDFTIRLGYNHFTDSLMAYDDCALDKAEVNNLRFITTKDGVQSAEDCNTVLQYCLTAFNCHIRQIDGKWYIANNFAVINREFEFDWLTLTEQSGGGSPSSKSLDINLYSFRSKGTVNKRRPVRLIDFTFQNKYIDDNLLTNGDFSSGTTGWSNGAGAVAWDSFSVGLAEYLTVEWAATEMDTLEFNRDTVVTVNEIDPDVDVIRLSCQARVTDIDSPNNPYLTIEVTNETSGVTKSYAYGQLSSDWQEMSMEFPTWGDGDYSFVVILDAKGNIINDLTVQFDDFEFWVDYEGTAVTVDKLNRITNTGLAEGLTEEYLVKFGDSLYTNDQGSIIMNGSLTYEWRSYGGSEDDNLLKLVGHEQLRAKAEYYDFVRADIDDPDDNITAERFLYFNSKYHRVAKFTKYFKHTRVSLELIEIKISGITTTRATINKSTVDGVSSGSSSSGTSGGSILWDNVLNTPTTLAGYGIVDGGGSPLTTKGDLFTFSTVDARLGVGTDGQFLKADSSQPTGLAWATVAGSGDVIKVGTPVDNELGVWTGDGTIEGNSGLKYVSGSLLVNPDSNSTHYIGRGQIGYSASDEVAIGHYDGSMTNEYAIKQNASFNTTINTGGTAIYFSRQDGTPWWEMTLTGMTGAAGQILSIDGELFLTSINTGAISDGFLVRDGSEVKEIVPSGTADATTFLRGDGSWATPAGGGSIGGAIATNQVAYGQSADTIKGEADFTYNDTTNTLIVDNLDLSGTAYLGDAVEIGLSSTPFAPTLAVRSSGTNTELFLVPKGTGTVVVRSSYEDDVVASSLVNKQWVDDQGFSKEYAEFNITTGGVTSVSTTATTLTLDKTRVNSNGSVFTLASNEVTIDKTGNFKFDIDVYFNSGGSTRSEYAIWVEVDTGGGYAEVTSTRSANYQRGYDSGQSCTINCILSVTSGDKFRIRTVITDGTGTTGYQDDNGTRVVITEL